MNNHEISRQLKALKDLLNKVDTACGTDMELRSHWAKYVCVLSAGFLENAIKAIYIEFVHRASHQPVATYASSKLTHIRNPKPGLFVETARAFKPSWGEDLGLYLQENGRGDASDSIMNNRHNIAHGRHYASGITIVRIRDYLDKSVEVIDYIEQQCAR